MFYDFREEFDPLTMCSDILSYFRCQEQAVSASPQQSSGP